MYWVTVRFSAAVAWESLISRLAPANEWLAVADRQISDAQRRPLPTSDSYAVIWPVQHRIRPTELARTLKQSFGTSLVAVVLLLGLPALAHAGLYKCIDEKTKSVTYSGTPCVSGTESAIIDGKPAPREVAGKSGEARQAPSAINASTPTPNNSEERKRLASECAAGNKGYQTACRALRALNGEAEQSQ